MVKREQKIRRLGLMPLAVGMVLLAVSAVAGDQEKPQHPELSTQEMLVDCADCHKQATPETEKEWFDSVHGLAMVKCYMCHGTFETFAVTPSKQTCATCHSDMLHKCPQDKACWQCHVPHSFKLKK